MTLHQMPLPKNYVPKENVVCPKADDTCPDICRHKHPHTCGLTTAERLGNRCTHAECGAIIGGRKWVPGPKGHPEAGYYVDAPATYPPGHPYAGMPTPEAVFGFPPGMEGKLNPGPCVPVEEEQKATMATTETEEDELF